MGNKKLHIAIIGVGTMGRRWARVAHDTEGCEVLYLVDADSEKANAVGVTLSDTMRVTNRLEDALNDAAVDAVVIATPHAFLAKISYQALVAGKHVLCEKPGGINVGEIKKALDVALQKNLRYMIAFNHRFHPAMWHAKELVDKGGIGKILFIRGRYGHGGRPGYNKEWRASEEMSGGGGLLDQGVHLIDLARWFLGDFDTVEGILTTNFWNIKPLEDNAFLTLKNSDDQVAHLHASWTQWKRLFSWEVYGDKGYVSVEGLGGKYGSETLTVGRRDDKFDVIEERKIFENPARRDPDDSLYNVWGEFVSAIRERREPRPSGCDALLALEVIEAIYNKHAL